jgi:hypothetical protein
MKAENDFPKGIRGKHFNSYRHGHTIGMRKRDASIRRFTMTKVEEIEKAIESLPKKDFKKILEWFSGKKWDEWDNEIKSDSDAGKLNFLVREAGEARKYGKLKDL